MRTRTLLIGTAHPRRNWGVPPDWAALFWTKPGLRHMPMSAGSTPNETELLLRASAGDADAFARFYDQTVRTVYGVALRFLKDSSLAQDLVQEVYLQVWERGASFNPALGKPMTWLVTLTRNRAVDRLRASARAGQFLQLAAETQEEGEHWLDDETIQTVRKAVNALPAEQRQALELAYFGGLSQSEIAAQLGQPLGTIKARIRRAMLDLRQRLKQCTDF